MAERVISDNIETAMARNPHLRRYVDEFVKRTGKFPDFYPQLSRDMKEIKYPNLIYPGRPDFYPYLRRHKRGAEVHRH